MVCFISEMVQALAQEAQKQAGENKVLSAGTMAWSDSPGILLNMANSALLLRGGEEVKFQPPSFVVRHTHRHRGFK